MTQFHPSLFKRKNKESVAGEPVAEMKQVEIPQNTLYEEPLVSQRRAQKRYVTIYGFTADNLEAVLEMARSCGEITEIEYGKNWVNVVFDGEEGVKRCLRQNTTMVGDEIVGVFRQGGGIVEDRDIFVRKKGVFACVMEYLFGD